jgi:hypothetical protein
VSTVYTFVPTTSAPFQFDPTLDGTTYTVVVTWNLFGRRFYANCYTQQGELIFAVPLIGSPVDYDINLAAGYFTTTMIYRTQSGNFEIGS